MSKGHIVGDARELRQDAFQRRLRAVVLSGFVLLTVTTALVVTWAIAR
ncbi:hypothetical protein [Paenarthrobacter sp. YIM B13468]